MSLAATTPQRRGTADSYNPTRGSPLVPSRPNTAVTAVSMRSRAIEEGSAALIFRQKTRRNRTFLKDNEQTNDLLPQPLPQGIPYVANFTTFDELIRRNILAQQVDEQVHLSTEDVRLIYDAKCVDQNLTPSWDREVRFMELLSANCKGNFFHLTENGLGKTSAEAVAHILSMNNTYSILDLSGNRLRDDGAASLAKLLTVNDTIVHLGLCSNDIGYEGGVALADALCDNNTLTSLDLGAYSGINRNHLGCRGAAALGNMLKANAVLCHLSVSSNGLGAEGMNFLSAGLEDNQCLTKLDLSSNNLGPEGARVLSSVLESTQLQHLDLQRNALTDRGGVQLCQAMSRSVENGLDTIEVLQLESNDLGEGFAKKMAAVLVATTKLKRLKLGNNDLTGGLKAIADALADNRSLVELSLSGCGLREKDGAVFAAAISTNKTLLVLDLSKNRLADEGASDIAEALRKNRTLRTVNLSSNMITDVGGLAIARAIRDNQALQEFNLRHNQMTSKSGEVLDDELRSNSTIQRMDVSFNDFTYRCFSGIQQTLARNQASWSALVVPRLNAEIEVLDVKQKELVQVEEDTELEHRVIKDRGDQILRRKEEIRTLTDKFRHDLHELEERLSQLKTLTDQAEEAYRFAEDRNTSEANILNGRKSNLEGKTQSERDKKDRIVRETEKLRKHLKGILEAEAEAKKPLMQELQKADSERNSDKADCKWSSEQLVTLNLKMKQLETQLGLSTQGKAGGQAAAKKKK